MTMTNFEAMRNLICEFDKMYKTVEEENKQLAKKIEAKSEEAYLMMCTELAPYYSLYLERGLPSIYVDLDMEIKHHDRTCNPVICFHANHVYVAARVKIGIDTGLNMYTITRRRDFMAYEYLNLDGYDFIIEVANNWNADTSKELENGFTKEIQKILTARAEKINRENEELRRGLTYEIH